jgi:hypothetical protein
MQTPFSAQSALVVQFTVQSLISRDVWMFWNFTHRGVDAAHSPDARHAP